MPDSLKKVAQAAAMWGLALLILAALWPAAIRLPQLWMVIGIGVLANVLQPAYSPLEGSRTVEDRGTAVQILWTVYLTQISALSELVWRKRQVLPLDSVAWISFAAMVCGLMLRTWAVVLLGPWFTWNVTVQSGQRLVTRGPYHVLRHPSYTGALFIFVASCLVLRSWITAVLATVALIAAFLRRIRYEEALLSKSFAEYESYATQTGKLFPRLFQNRSIALKKCA